jgi:hypothetical protein
MNSWAFKLFLQLLSVLPTGRQVLVVPLAQLAVPSILLAVLSLSWLLSPVSRYLFFLLAVECFQSPHSSQFYL